MTITDKEIVDRVESKLECAIRTGLNKGIPLTRSNYRAVIRPHGFSTAYWDYRRQRDNITIHNTFAFDLIIIGSRVDEDRSQTHSVGKALQLPYRGLAHSIDCGFQGYDFRDCEVNYDHSITNIIDLSKKLYNVGSRLREKFRREIG